MTPHDDVEPDRDEERGGPVDHQQPAYDPAEDGADLRELADAERAAARHGATAEQADRLARADGARRAEDRLAGWREPATER